MKKALAILLTAVMLLGVLTACGSKKDDAADDTQNTEDTDKAAADNVAALIDALRDRPEGFVADGTLVPGRPISPLLPFVEV